MSVRRSQVELPLCSRPQSGGGFPGISEGAPSQSIEEAARMATDLGADGLIAVGAGSVIKGARVVAMIMGEKRPLEDMATRHVEGQAAISQKLPAPGKVPIFNVLTSPTSAQNRGGSAVRHHHGDVHHLEFFDPKTRPRRRAGQRRAGNRTAFPGALDQLRYFWWAR